MTTAKAEEPKRDWRRLTGDSEGRPEFTCERCGRKYAVNVPVSLGILAAVSRVFLKEHKRCRP